jgi:hypothetical protein
MNILHNRFLAPEQRFRLFRILICVEVPQKIDIPKALKLVLSTLTNEPLSHVRTGHGDVPLLATVKVN